MTSFHAIEQYHHDLERLFAEHQAHLVEKRFGDAGAALRHFRAALEIHIAEEERELLPLMRAFAGDPTGGGAPAIRSEHRKLLQLLEALFPLLESLAGDPSAAGLIAMIEREAQFKNLFTHHAAREHNVLFPVLDRVLGETERARVLAQCTQRVATTGEELIRAPEHRLVAMR